LSRDDEGFLARWSRRKTESRKAPEELAPAPVLPPQADSAMAPVASAAAPAPPELPPLESLTPHSDFSAFMQPDVDPSVKGQALKKLFSDPALYPMDGLDTYIADYAKPDPLPEGWLAKLNQLATLHGEPAEPAPREADAAVLPDAGSAELSPTRAERSAPSASSNTSATADSAPESGNRDAT
jgi:hypothetical protein